MKIIFLLLAFVSACSHNTNQRRAVNKVLPIEAWGDVSVEEHLQFRFYKGASLDDLKKNEWENAYGISLAPLGEIEWIEYLQFNDGVDLVKIVLENGPLNKIKSRPSDMQEFAKKIPDYIEQSKKIGIKGSKVKSIYLFRDVH